MQNYITYLFIFPYQQTFRVDVSDKRATLVQQDFLLVKFVAICVRMRVVENYPPLIVIHPQSPYLSLLPNR